MVLNVCIHDYTRVRELILIESENHNTHVS